MAVSSLPAVSNGSKMRKTREKGKAKNKAEKSKVIGFDFLACPYQKMSQKGMLLQRKACFHV